MSIDVSSLNGMYNQFISDKAKTSEMSIDTNKDYSKATDDELMDVCKKFEAYFLEQCFKEMMKTTGNDDELSSGSMSTLVDYYKDSFVQEIASQSTEKEGLGLAQTLYEQMKRNYDL